MVGYVSRIVLVEKSTPFVGTAPTLRSVGQRLGKNDRIACIHLGLYHLGRHPLQRTHILWQILGKIALVATRNTYKPTISCPGWSQHKSHDS